MKIGSFSGFYNTNNIQGFSGRHYFRMPFLQKKDVFEKSSKKTIVIQKPENFFINIEGYGRNDAWANCMVEVSRGASDLISKKSSFEDVMGFIAKKCNDYELENVEETLNFERCQRVGRLRFDSNKALVTNYKLHGERYSTYGERYKNKALSGKNNGCFVVKTPEEFPNSAKTMIFYNGKTKNGNLIQDNMGIQTSFKYAGKLYGDLIDKYLDKKLNKRDIKEINKQIASIHWLLAHASVYERGSDSIANVFVKSLYGALGIETSPAKPGISFDLEAFCTEYTDFVKKYPKFYENEPHLAG